MNERRDDDSFLTRRHTGVDVNSHWMATYVTLVVNRQGCAKRPPILV